MTDPRECYRERTDALINLRDRALAREETYSRARMLSFLGGAISVGWALATGRSVTPFVLVFGLGFLVFVVLHLRLAGRRREHERGLEFYAAGQRRLDGEWRGKGVAGESFGRVDHPYVDHLDLFGEGSLFELLCTARSASGRSVLAGWLSEPADVAEARARQKAVAELRPAVEEREAIARLDLHPPGPEAALHLRAWAARPLPTNIQSWRLALALLGATQLAFLGAWLLGPWPITPFLASSVVVMLVSRRVNAPVEAALAAAEAPVLELRLLIDLVRRLETSRFESPRLVDLHDAVAAPAEGTASGHIASLVGWLERGDLARNPLIAPLAFLVLWRAQAGFAVEQWRKNHGQQLDGWLRAIGEWEALQALGSFAFEHPHDAVPQFVEEGRRLEAKGLAHPLLTESQAVTNDLELGDTSRLWMLSGSNMSGKSTLLRSLGCNVVLARAGATVRASEFTLSPLQVAASLRSQDSLLDGRSRFAAEVEALRRVRLACEGDETVLFLLDELFSGTNSHDRQEGARALVHSLLDAGGMGLVTTHDLALTEMVEAIDGARNVHFTDEITDGELRFDYRLREGVVRGSNALEVLRRAGLLGPERA